MSKVKKSVTALLLLGSLACPAYGNENLKYNMLNCQNVRNLPVCSDKSKQIVKKENPGCVPEIVPWLLFGFAAGFGTYKGIGYLRSDNSEKSDCLDQSISKFKDNNAWNSDSYFEEDSTMDSSVLSEESSCFSTYVEEHFDEILKPFINQENYIHPMSEDLKKCLIYEIAETVNDLNENGYSQGSYPLNYLLPLTLIRVYKLNNVWNAMKEFGRNKFEFVVDYDVYAGQKERVDVVYGESRGTGSCYPPESGYSGCKCIKNGNKDVEVRLYYPLLKDWFKKLCEYCCTADDFNNSEEASFCRMIRGRTVSGAISRSNLTLPLLRYIYWFEFIFTPDGFIFKTDDRMDGMKINFCYPNVVKNNL